MMNFEPSPEYDRWDGCRNCRLFKSPVTCRAYPAKIPLPIISGDCDHMVTRPGQTGVFVYEPIAGEKYNKYHGRGGLFVSSTGGGADALAEEFGRTTAHTVDVDAALNGDNALRLGYTTNAIKNPEHIMFISPSGGGVQRIGLKPGHSARGDPEILEHYGHEPFGRRAGYGDMGGLSYRPMLRDGWIRQDKFGNEIAYQTSGFGPKKINLVERHLRARKLTGAERITIEDMEGRGGSYYGSAITFPISRFRDNGSNLTRTILEAGGLKEWSKNKEWAEAQKAIMEWWKINIHHDRYGKFASGSGSDFQGQVAQAADQLAMRAKIDEPEVTTTIIHAALMNDGVATGLDFRLKDKASIQRKITAEARVKPEQSIDEIARGVGDPLRYTIVFPAKSYDAGVRGVMAELQAKGLTPVKVNNWWGSNEYKGLNCQFRTSRGVRCEVQVHTPRSWHTKQYKTHPLYEKMRTERRPTVRNEIRGDMAKVWDAVPVPKGATSFNFASITALYKELKRGVRALLRAFE